MDDTIAMACLGSIVLAIAILPKDIKDRVFLTLAGLAVVFIAIIGIHRDIIGRPITHLPPSGKYEIFTADSAKNLYAIRMKQDDKQMIRAYLLESKKVINTKVDATDVNFNKMVVERDKTGLNSCIIYLPRPMAIVKPTK